MLPLVRIHGISRSLHENSCVGYPLGLTKQFYQIDAELRIVAADIRALFQMRFQKQTCRGEFY